MVCSNNLCSGAIHSVSSDGLVLDSCSGTIHSVSSDGLLLDSCSGATCIPSVSSDDLLDLCSGTPLMVCCNICFLVLYCRSPLRFVFWCYTVGLLWWSVVRIHVLVL